MNESEKKHLFEDTLRETPTQIGDPRKIKTTILGQ